MATMAKMSQEQETNIKAAIKKAAGKDLIFKFQLVIDLMDSFMHRRLKNPNSVGRNL